MPQGYKPSIHKVESIAGAANAKPSRGMRMSFCAWAFTGLVTFVLCVSSAWPQQAASPTIQGKVSDGRGAPVSGAAVHLEHAGAQVAETKTSADGSFTFRDLRAGDYTVVAEEAGKRSAPKIIQAERAETQRVDLVLGESAPTPTDDMEFADAPKFTVAAVTDWTAAGGHGSDAVLRTSEALNRETLRLKAAQPPKAETSGTWRKQESTLRAAQASAPDSFATNHALGEFYLKSEKFDEAVPALEAAYKFEPTDFNNEYDLAFALIGKGEYTGARDHIQKLNSGRESADVDRLQGELDEKLGDPLNAVHEFERAVRLQPTEQNYFAWGSELLLHRAVWQARDVFAAGVKAYPKSARMLTALGAALFAGALYDEAAEKLCTASDLDPTDPEPYTFMGKIEISAPNPLRCVEEKLATFVAQRPDDPVANYFYAMALWKQKGPELDPPTLARIESLLDTAVRLDAKCSDAWLQLGVLQTTHRDYSKAIDFYTKAIEANPQMSEAHYRLGIAYDRIGEKEKSAEQLRLHDEIEKQQAATVEKQRREVKQFRVVVDGQKANANPSQPDR
jgi:tetratricopeptide (TPR) repeat protein